MLRLGHLEDPFVPKLSLPGLCLVTTQLSMERREITVKPSGNRF